MSSFKLISVYLGDIQKYVRSRFPFLPPTLCPPFSPLIVFEPPHTPFQKNVRSFSTSIFG